MRNDQGAFRRLLQSYFCSHLMMEREVSDKTVSSYRDVFRLFTRFWKDQKGATDVFQIANFKASLVLDFLKYLEKERRNAIRTRNHRLAGIHSFAEYVAMAEPRYAGQMQAILAIPPKRHDKPMVSFLEREEIDALLDAPALNRWSGRRDRVMFRFLYNTGARISEAVAVLVRDLELRRQPSVTLHGKGRKERVIPLWKNTSAAIKEWIKENDLNPHDSLFTNVARSPLTRSGAEKRLASAVKAASIDCPSLGKKSVSPHVLRHSTAMHMLQSGVDITLIALWLGHSSTNTTHGYIEADLAMKEKALSAVSDPKKNRDRFRAPKDILAFLEEL